MYAISKADELHMVRVRRLFGSDGVALFWHLLQGTMFQRRPSWSYIFKMWSWSRNRSYALPECDQIWDRNCEGIAYCASQSVVPWSQLKTISRMKIAKLKSAEIIPAATLDADMRTFSNWRFPRAIMWIDEGKQFDTWADTLTPSDVQRHDRTVVESERVTQDSFIKIIHLIRFRALWRLSSPYNELPASSRMSLESAPACPHWCSSSCPPHLCCPA